MRQIQTIRITKADKILSTEEVVKKLNNPWKNAASKMPVMEALNIDFLWI
jgi:hypothetical protein